jgi:MraZ protein
VKPKISGETVFRGSSNHTIDIKGRIIIPTRFRDMIRTKDEDGVVITRMDKCLKAYPFKAWEEIEQKILSLSVKSETMRRFRRVFVGGAFECTCDKQGRVLIPPTLREYAKLEKEIVLVGVLDHFEIWSRDRWNTENSRLDEDLKKEDVRLEIAELGL